MHSYNLNVFELEISFKTEADAQRVDLTCAYAESLYKGLKLHGQHLGRDRLLAILIIGITDDLLQLKQKLADRDQRIAELVQKIEESKITVE